MKIDNQKFIESMRRKYGQYSKPQVQGFAGEGNANEPAGVYHKGEVVIPKHEVIAAGGPEAFSGLSRTKLPGAEFGTNVVDRVKKTAYDYGANIARTFNPDNTDIVAPQSTTLAKTTETTPTEVNAAPEAPITRTTTVAPVIPQETDVELPKVQTTSGSPEQIDAMRGVVTPKTRYSYENYTPNMDAIKRPDTTEREKKFTNLLDTQVGRLNEVATGKSLLDKTIGDISRRSLSGSLASQSQANLQTAAQLGMTGGEAAAARARTERDSNIAQTNLEGQLAVDALGRAQQATTTLASIAQQGEAFEQAKAQWGAEFDLKKENFGLDVDKYNESKKQFSAQLGLQEEQFDQVIKEFQWKVKTYGEDVARQDLKDGNTIKLAQANALINSDDPKSIEQGWALLDSITGTKTDITAILADAKSDKIANNFANVIETLPSIGGKSITNPDGTINPEVESSQFLTDVAQYWNSQHPDSPAKVDGKYTTEFLKEANNIAINLRANDDPMKRVLDTIDDNDVALLFGDADLSNFTYGKFKGEEAGKAALGSLVQSNAFLSNGTGGFYLNPDHTLTASEIDLIDKITTGGKGYAEGDTNKDGKVDAGETKVLQDIKDGKPPVVSAFNWHAVGDGTDAAKIELLGKSLVGPNTIGDGKTTFNMSQLPPSLLSNEKVQAMLKDKGYIKAIIPTDIGDNADTVGEFTSNYLTPNKISSIKQDFTKSKESYDKGQSIFNGSQYNSANGKGYVEYSNGDTFFRVNSDKSISVNIPEIGSGKIDVGYIDSTGKGPIVMYGQDRIMLIGLNDYESNSGRQHMDMYYIKVDNNGNPIGKVEYYNI